LALALAATGICLSACGDPCVDLSKKICKCEPSDTEQQACMQLVDVESKNVEANDKQKDQCADLLDSCTCDKLADGDLAACGLAHDSP
jgi:hypothetical protein